MRLNEQIGMKVQQGLLAVLLELNAKQITFFPRGVVPYDSSQLCFFSVRNTNKSAHRKIVLHDDTYAVPRDILHIAELL